MHVRLHPFLFLAKFSDIREPESKGNHLIYCLEVKERYPQLAYIHLVEPQAREDHKAYDIGGQLEQEAKQ